MRVITSARNQGATTDRFTRDRAQLTSAESTPGSCACDCRGITSTCSSIGRTGRSRLSAACWRGSWMASPARTLRSRPPLFRGSRRWPGPPVDAKAYSQMTQMERRWRTVFICVLSASSADRPRRGWLRRLAPSVRTNTFPPRAVTWLFVATVRTDRVPLGHPTCPVGHRPCPTGTPTVPRWAPTASHWNTDRAPRGHRPCPIGTPIVSQWDIDGAPVGHPQCPRGSAALLKATTVGWLDNWESGHYNAEPQKRV